MNKRLIVRSMISLWIGMSILVITGCGRTLTSESPIDEMNGGEQMTEQLLGDAIISNEKNGSVKIVYTVKNQSEEDVELTFPNGLKADYILYDEAGNKKAKYSEDVFTTMAVEHLTLHPEEELTHEFVIRHLKSGTYSVTLFLNVAGKKGKVTKSFTI
ncbi:BsuPI-related putative proteinase inhibitor [Bacillus sp. CGMCC 1.16541]|uniref:BsuPI-related putative proteinase inhibitor n=1 Tax=Bacillus sp. CGMCC 1.16541 TaxID=2185143 RepID=UPI0013A5B49D|nr:BsuPI-related putative proteinase inhibitor [Bacillus sp. CGMCC 1.16541]